jgi:hypothetical protein
MPGATAADSSISQLETLFREHPAWVRAAAKLEPAATSAVFFAHRPGEPWRLERIEGVTRLLPGAAADPDFVFCFPPRAIERLAGVEGDIGSFAVELFQLITESDPELRVGFRVAVPFPRLVRRGYLGLLAAGGWRVLAFGASHGVRSVAQLRGLVDVLRHRDPESWERF